MRGYVILGDEAIGIDLAPGPRLADGRPVSLHGERLTLNGEDFPVVVARDGESVWIHLEGHTYRVHVRDAVAHLGRSAEAGLDNTLRAPMPGVVVEVLVANGAPVAKGEALMVIESMKLETTLRAVGNSVIETVHFEAGQSFSRDATLITLSEAD